MGGTDDSSNLIELTVEEHAEAHRLLYEEHGKREDLVAWKGLSEQIGKEEIFLATSSMGGHSNKGKPKSEEHRKKISDANKMNEIFRTPKVKKIKQKISNSMKGNTNSKNHSSEDYKKKQSLAMKEAWARRKQKLLG